MKGELKTMMRLMQDCECEIIYDKKTVDWLVNNTSVRTFDNINFTGYQRKVNESHVSKIVDYLMENNFYLPTSIICASDEDVAKDTRLHIVDGQHRVEAFKTIKVNNLEKYNEIKNYELSVIILQKPSEMLEVDTFITINKTSRKVDTSLAYVLKNKINKENKSSSDLTIAKKEFLAVELAINLNNDAKFLWYNKILLEGNPTKNLQETISLNSFVKSVQNLIGYLEKYKILKIDWNNDTELSNVNYIIKFIYIKIWDVIRIKWPVLFTEEFLNKSVIQGTIGVSSINKYIILQLKQGKIDSYDLDLFVSNVEYWIRNLNISQNLWYKRGYFSQFSSAAGFNIVANYLLDAFES